MLLTLLNVDFVLAPAVRTITSEFWGMFGILVVLANIELVLWYRFWRWFFVRFLPERRQIRETVEFAKELGGELKRKGYIDRVIDHFENTFKWATNPDRWLFRVVKAWGHAGMLFLGFEPFITGGRLIGVIFCATTGWKQGLISLLIGNAVHVMITIGSWEIIYYLIDQFLALFR